MARECLKSHKSHRDVKDKSPQTKSKFPKLSKAQELAILSIVANSMNSVVPSSVQLPVQQISIVERTPKDAKAANVTKARKVKERVSIAGVFKKGKKQAQEKKHRNSREYISDPDLVIDFQDGLETACAALYANSKDSFDSIRASFEKRLTISRSSDEAFINFVSAAAEKLSTPLLDEQIEIESMKNDKRVKETISIGKRITQVRKIVEKEDAKLKDLWNQWDEMQNEYVELGIYVFGANAFCEEVSTAKSREKGFKREIELLEFEHSTNVDGLNDEIEEIRTKVMQKMKSSERALDAAMKKEQAKFLQALMNE